MKLCNECQNPHVLQSNRIVYEKSIQFEIQCFIIPPSNSCLKNTAISKVSLAQAVFVTHHTTTDLKFPLLNITAR